MIVATHGHFDHVMAAFALQRAYNIPFYIHQDDIFLLKTMRSSAVHFLGLRDVDPPPTPSPIEHVSFIHTPGHTPGSICMQFDKMLVIGDTLFADGGIGRTDFTYSDPRKFKRSINKIRSYPRGTRLLPGHGEELYL